jgi:hypothetical protein
MASLGQKLAEARNRKGISIREASDTTKIRGDYLTKFENDNFEVNLPPVYLRGFLTNYASYLDLDPEGILADFAVQQPADKHPPTPGFGTITVDTPDGEGLPGESPKPQQKSVPDFPWVSVCITLGSLLAVTIFVIIIVNLWSGDDEPEPKTPDSGTVVEPGVGKAPLGTTPGENNHQLKLIATGPISKLFIRLDGQAAQIFDDLKEGDVHEFEFKEFFKGGASLRENLMVEIDGAKDGNKDIGLKLFLWPAKKD